MHQLQLLYTWFVTRRGEEGATAVEYGMIVALIAAVIVAVLGFLGTDVKNTFQTMVDAI